MNKNLLKKIGKYFRWQYFLLLPLPSITFIIREISKLYTGPYWFASNFDPEYAYLFNSLNVIHFFKIEYVDHPGTPLQVLGGVVIFLYNLFFRDSKVNEDVVLNSDLYLNVINIVIIFLLSITLYIAGMVIYIKSKNIIYGLLIQITPFLSMSQALSQTQKTHT